MSSPQSRRRLAQERRWSRSRQKIEDMLSMDELELDKDDFYRARRPHSASTATGQAVTAKIWTLGIIVLTTLLAIMAVTVVDKYGPNPACEMSDC
jgi:hypothetical protein